MLRLGTKIAELRTENGMTQEELAEQLRVSARTVQKWEAGERIPEVDQLLQLSKLFHVSTDYLLKEETMPVMAQAEQREKDHAMPAYDELRDREKKDRFAEFRRSVEKTYFENSEEKQEEKEPYLLKESEVLEFLEERRRVGIMTAAGVGECVASPVPMILLAGIQATFFPQMESLPVLGVAVLIAMVAHAVTLFIQSGRISRRAAFLSETVFEPDPAAELLIQETAEREKEDAAKKISAGVSLCILSIIPVIVISAIAGRIATVFATAGVAGMLMIIAAGVYLLVNAGYQNATVKMLLQRGKYRPSVKNTAAHFGSVYWLVMTATYLGYSAVTGDWHISWIIWVLAGIAYPIVMGAGRKD